MFSPFYKHPISSIMASQRFPASQKIHPSHSRAPSLHSNAPWTALIASSIDSSPERRLISSALLPPSLFVQLARSGLVAAPRADRKKRTEDGRQDRLDNQLVCYSWNYPISQLYCYLSRSAEDYQIIFGMEVFNYPYLPQTDRPGFSFWRQWQ